MEHQPVLLAEVLDFLSGLENGGVFLDATLGLGGHARAVLETYPKSRVIGVDRDVEMQAVARQRLVEFGERIEFHHAPFAELDRVCETAGVEKVHGVLFDLGVSSPQLDTAERGFSFRHDAPLDMRMDRSEGETAADLVNRLPEKELGNLIYELGEERASRRVARAIVVERRRERIETTGRLAEIVRRVVRGSGRIDAATRTFQALRMAVNEEREQLAAGLDAAAGRLAPGGRVITISFHSGEDRICKNALRADERLTVLTKKIVRPSREEARGNRRARSAKLRAAERRQDVA